jgi:threonyl-tRNA synthetase
MIEIVLKDGSVKRYEKGISAINIAKDISEGLARNALSASFNGSIIELSKKISENGKLNFYTWNDDEGKSAFWHSSAHILAQTVLSLYPKVKLTIGPSIENGFYYDFDLGDESISENDFPKIEEKFMFFASKKSDFKLKFLAKSDAKAYYKKKKNSYKLELIENLKDGEITFCDHSNFTDLCKGGHIPHTGLVKAIKLTNIAGAYWKGDENNKQLTRIYGISFPKQKFLKEYNSLIEEANKRDHRKIGKELNLFTFSSRVGLGLPLWLPKGTDLKNRLEFFLKKAQDRAGYEMVESPHIGKKELYETSGHYEKYGSDSFQPIETPGKRETFLLKPMNCPHHCEIYNSQNWSYKDLPIRYAEFGTVYRYEQSGELHGLTRVRGFTQDDAHIFCTPEQLEEEFIKVIDLVAYVFKAVSFNNFIVQVSLRDPKTPDKYIGSDKNWNLAEKAILKAADIRKLDYKIEYGEAAFYGPKLDFMVKDALGRKWQLGTIQVDYNLPERFDLKYKSSGNKYLRPVMIHRAPFGSLERFIAILLEHTGGKLPLWLIPDQLIILTLSEKFEKYAEKVLNEMKINEIRALIDNRNETIGKKIRDAQLKKYPYMLIVGEKEMKDNVVSVRHLIDGDLGSITIETFIQKLSADIKKSYSFDV